MKTSLLLTAILLVSVARISTFFTANAAVSEPIDHVLELFHKYIDANKKQYKTPDEYNYRFNVFRDQLGKIVDGNKPLKDQVNIESTQESTSSIKIIVNQGSNPCQFIRNLNQFADLSDEEFNRYYLMSDTFLDTHKNQPLKNVIRFENETTETKELKMKLNDKNYDLFTDALAAYQGANAGNKIDVQASEGQASYKDLLMNLLQPKSDEFNGVPAKEKGVSDTCISYMYRTHSKTSSKIETPFGSFTKTTTSKSLITGIKFTTKTANLANMFPTPKRMLQSSRYRNRSSRNGRSSTSRRNIDYDYDTYDNSRSGSDDYDDNDDRYYRSNYRDDRRSSAWFNDNEDDKYSRRSNNSRFDDSPKSSSIPSSQSRDPFSQSSSAGYTSTPSPARSSSSGPNIPSQAKSTSQISIGGVKVPSYLDWRDADILSPIKDQKKCKGCYAFSAIAAVEANNALVNKQQTIFSEQEILDCSTENNGCEGGLPGLVFDYIQDKGISSEKDYPYKGVANGGTCQADSIKKKFTGVSGHIYVKKGVLSLIKALQFGPIAVISFASTEFKFYSSGVFNGEGCDGIFTPNHSSLLVGYNLQAQIPYFILKNAWTKDWGLNGYYYMAIGELSDKNEGKCLLAATDYNSFPIIRKMR